MTGEKLDDPLDGLLADLVFLLGDGGQGGVDELADFDVIEPHHGDVLRYTHPCFSGGAQHAESHHVIAGEYRGGWIRPAEELLETG